MFSYGAQIYIIFSNKSLTDKSMEETWDIVCHLLYLKIGGVCSDNAHIWNNGTFSG